MIAWATDAVMLVPEKTMVCYQSATVNAVGKSLDELGEAHHTAPSFVFLLTFSLCAACVVRRGRTSTVPTQPSRSWCTFVQVDQMLVDFQLLKSGIDFALVLDVFKQTSGGVFHSHRCHSL